MEEVILVDVNDQTLGTMEKLKAHQLGRLHRAVSVFIFNSKQELLLQQRAFTKYHSAGLWTNTCCSHPRSGELPISAAKRRLQEEMGLDVELHFSGTFIYKAALDQGLTEHELDHVFYGTSDALPILNPEEVHAYRWISKADLEIEIQKFPERFTYWFPLALHRFY